MCDEYGILPFAICEWRRSVKSQDIVVLSVLMKGDVEKPSYQYISKSAKISVSEAHASIRRLYESDLVNLERHLKKRNVEEFLIHGLRYMFPMKATGELAYGMPTSYAAPVSADEFAISGNVPVWRSSKGRVLGRSHELIYPTVPDAAAEDPELYDRIAVLDMLRGGRLRERRFAEQKIREYLA